MNYDRHRAAIERLYDDRATIKRHGEIEKPSGETVLGLAVICEDQPCRLSQKSLAVNGQTEAQNDVSYETKLFVSPDLELRQGDVVEVTRHGRALTYVAGEPFIYATHQEVNLQRKEYA
ncbi:ABC transporter ATP-binding protein [Tumebacillus algifaecis]|uniref:ABC transporter ATP-binding protein n=1 Tax=Tumebacillus algifaecis TaxID=1214604 RepID=A0A223D754_9BACL|nr:ABC transporter ATP-binding protein [Tumebacillus algifaecis]